MGNAYGHSMHKPDGAYSTLVSGPTVPAVSLPDLKEHVVAVGFTEDDSLLTSYAMAATAMFDAAGGGYLGRAIVTQRWSMVSSGFPAGDNIVLPVPVVQQVASVTYFDTEGVEQTLDPASYRLIVNGDHADMVLEPGQSWPDTMSRADAVTVLYDAGYGDVSDDVPDAIKQAVLIVAAGLYENRIDAGQIPAGVRQMVAGFRVPHGYF